MDLRESAAPSSIFRSALTDGTRATAEVAAEVEPALARLQDDLAALIDRVSPAVVAIETDRSPTAMQDGPPHDPRSWTSTGSGVVVRADGMILTSQHVLADALAIHVTLHDGRRLRGRHVASDPRADLAVIQITVNGLQAAELGDVRSLRRGHLVLAMGNPLGLAGDGQAAVSLGVVSAIARPLPGTFGQEEDRYYGDMIQTSAAIQPGHSGGPLLDIRGNVVGILTAVSTPAGGGEGIAFAVPIAARTRQVIDRLLEGRSVEYGYIGVEVGSLGRAQMLEAGLLPGEGAIVASVSADSPARRAGLKEGDIVVSAAGRNIASADEFIQVVGSLEPGSQVEMEYLRGAERQTALVEVKRRPVSSPTLAQSSSITFRGAVLGAVDGALRQTANLPEHALVVWMVGDESPAGRAGLSPGDIVVQVDGQPLSAESGIQLGKRTDECLLGLANGGSILVPAR